MPKALAKSCRVMGCGHTVPCPTHPPRQPWTSSGAPTPERIRGRRLQRLRQQLFDRQPLCVPCEAKGYVTAATIRDHIIPLAEGGTDTEDNVQALCQDCSDAKTADESQRGSTRART